jgi:hypothetical protein
MGLRATNAGPDKALERLRVYLKGGPLPAQV